MKNSIKFICTTSLLICSLSSGLQAEGLQTEGLTYKAKRATPTLQATTQASPPVCATGFTAVGKKLQKHEGKQWYTYTCARQEQIKRVCNADTQVTEVNDKITSLPSDGQSNNSKLTMSYKCFNYVPVK